MGILFQWKSEVENILIVGCAIFCDTALFNPKYVTIYVKQIIPVNTFLNIKRLIKIA